MNHVGRSHIDELPASYITDLKDLNAALVECLKDTKVGAAVETWHGHIVVWESASRDMSCLGAVSEEGEVQMVVREFVVSLDKCRKDHLSISFEHDATLGALLSGYGRMVAESWCCNAQVNLASACDKLRTAKAKSLASSTMKLKQICRGSCLHPRTPRTPRTRDQEPRWRDWRATVYAEAGVPGGRAYEEP